MLLKVYNFSFSAVIAQMHLTDDFKGWSFTKTRMDFKPAFDCDWSK